MNIIDLVIIFPAFFATCSLLYWTIRLGIGPLPTSGKVSQTLYQHLPDEVHGQIIELGCGWGHLIKKLKQKYPDRTVIGYERSPIPCWVTSRFYRTPVRRADFFDADLSEAGLLVCYLYPQAMQRIREELLPKVPSGCIIITHTFALQGLKPETISRSDDLYGTPVYCYLKP